MTDKRQFCETLKWIPDKTKEELTEEKKRQEQIEAIEQRKIHFHLIRIVVLASMMIVLVFSLYMPLLFIVCAPLAAALTITLNKSHSLEKEKQKILYSK